MEDIDRTLATLTAMIVANHKRSKHYQSLAEKTNHQELRPVFASYADQSRRFVSSLSTWRSAYGGFATERNTSGKAWVQIRTLLDFGMRKNVLVKCEELEQDMLALYKAAINSSYIPASTATDIQQQYKEYEKALAKVRVLRERPAAAREVFART